MGLHTPPFAHTLRLTVVVLHFTACKATQRDPNFQVVARVEAFIAGWGLEEVLKRSHAYVDAGADAILMHSKRKDPSEIKAFMDAWDGRAPVVGVFSHISAPPNLCWVTDRPPFYHVHAADHCAYQVLHYTH